jgi:hypothetical protein
MRVLWRGELTDKRLRGTRGRGALIYSIQGPYIFTGHTLILSDPT